MEVQNLAVVIFNYDSRVHLALMFNHDQRLASGLALGSPGPCAGCFSLGSNRFARYDIFESHLSGFTGQDWDTVGIPFDQNLPFLHGVAIFDFDVRAVLDLKLLQFTSFGVKNIKFAITFERDQDIVAIFILRGDLISIRNLYGSTVVGTEFSINQ